jgi:hypothetical protein
VGRLWPVRLLSLLVWLLTAKLDSAHALTKTPL